MKKIYGRSLKRALSLSVALVMSLTPALAAKIEAECICGKEPHQHTEACYTEVEVKELTCTFEGHTHDDSCFTTQWNQICGQDETPESHAHGDECYIESKTPQACGQTEHTHDSSCYTEEKSLSCGEAESTGHSHGSSCYNEEDGNLTCGQEESAGHSHSDSCYTTNSIMGCGQSEHTHSESCEVTTKTLTCPISDAPAHRHESGCFEQVKVWTCGEDASHTHGDECYTVTGTQGELTCATEEHTHSASCYRNQAVGYDEGTTLEEALKEALGGTDKDVYLILNGVDLNYNESNSEKNNGIVVSDGYKLTIDDNGLGGEINGNDEVRVIKITTGGSVTLKGGTITGGSSSGGSGVYVGSGGSFTMEGGEISGNTATNYDYRGHGYESNGGGVLVEGGTFEMTGGTITNNSAVGGNGGGVAIKDAKDIGNHTGHASFNMSGGTISNNHADTKDPNKQSEPIGQGGGVYVGQESEFKLSGGTISGNTAGEGGGIFIDGKDVSRYYDGTMINGDYHQDGKFTMTGGTVDGNKAYVGEGGGIYIQGTGEISKGQITNNETYTFKDLGGGGIYIEADGTLTLTNAIITNNTANGFGGGIAGCVHGKTIVYAQDGAAIYKNTALGKGHTEGYTKPDGTNNGSLIDGYTLWAGSDIFKEYGQDIFAAGDATKGAAGIIVGNDMLGGQSANWEGYTYCYALDADGNLATENGQYILELTKVTNTNNGAVFGNRLVFLTSNPDQAAIDAAVDAMNKMEDKGVLISGNLSANTHGGGIANNGMLIIGKEDKVTGTNSYRPEIDANKTLTDTSDNSQKDLIEGQFTFELVDENEKVVGTVSNLGNGKTPNFEFPADTFTKKGTYTFTVREVKGNDSTIDYDGTVYQITIVVTEKEETVRIGNKTIVVTTLTVGDPLIQKINDKDGNAIDPTIVTSIDFNNTYTPEKKDPPPPSTEDGEDPKDPPEDPEDPGEDIPDPEVPLAPPPEEEITEPEVPLAPPPEEEVEIPEEPVPLADVPATGDISILWYAAALMSACGLAVLNLFKKKTEE